MDEIVTAIKHLTEIMADITSASKEQSTGIEQVNQAVTQMDEVTQQNAALVEQAAAAAASLEQQAHELVGAISIFNLANNSMQKSTGVVHLANKRNMEPARLSENNTTSAKLRKRNKIAVGDHNNQWSEF